MPSLAQKWGIKVPLPLTPRALRDSMRDLIMAEVLPDEIARALRKRWRAGEWSDEPGEFSHLNLWKYGDWLQLATSHHALVPKREIAGRPKAPRTALKAKKAAQEARERAEAQAEELGAEDPKERLDRLRKEILKRLTIEEQAELLVSQARGDHAQTAKAATSQIIEILGMKAANVPEAQNRGPIFALPVGAGPSIR